MLLGSGPDFFLGSEADLDVVELDLEQQVGLDIDGTSEASGLEHGLELARGKIVAVQRLELELGLGLGLELLPSDWEASAVLVPAVSAQAFVAVVGSSGAQVWSRWEQWQEQM